MKSCPECTATYPDDYAICPRDGAPLQESTLWKIGTVVHGKYRIQARLGEGGMAIVYKAHHELLDEIHALKVIKPELARDPEFMSRFYNEAIMARKLNHPNAVRVYDLDIAEDGLPFIAMELVVGDTLNTWAQRVGPLPVSLVLDVALHVCDALDAAHKLGLVHRDIKPDNIVLIPQREGLPKAKILDFGICRLREETAGAKGLTQTGMMIGTPEYMSPEQALGKRGGAIDGRSDIYSLGIVMYRMLTGELPFKAETTVEMVLHHLRTVPTPPHRLKPELAIPEAVSAVVMKALEKDRAKRFETGAAMATAMKRARGSTTLDSRKINWDSLSSVGATFGKEKGAAGSLADGPAAERPATPNSPAPAARAPDKPIYRSSLRAEPPRKEFPTRLVWTLVVLVLLIGWAIAATLAAWKYYASTRAAQQPATHAASPVSSAPPPAQRKSLNYDEQARIVELKSLAAIDYRKGGCEKALPVYRQILEIDPGDAQAYAAVQKCFAKARGVVPNTPAISPEAAPNQ
jgi:serine/threonine protein kinase